MNNEVLMMEELSFEDVAQVAGGSSNDQAPSATQTGDDYPIVDNNPP